MITYFDKEKLKMKRFIALLLISVLCLGLAACGEASAPVEQTASASQQLTAGAGGFVAEEPIPEVDVTNSVCFTDSLGREITVESADRVAVLIGSFTDIWILAGGKDRIVAAANDSWTNFDLDLADTVVNTGSVKDPELEVILGAEPDFVIASSNTKADIELLETFENAGLNVAYFDVENFNDYLNMLDICTQITGCRDNFEKYGLEVQKQVEEAKKMVDGSAPSVLYVRASGSSVTVKGSEGNLLGEMLDDLGCVNIADSDTAILENLSLERIIADDPDFIFAVCQGADPTDAQNLLESTLLSNPAWNTLTAVKEGRFMTLENQLYNLKPNADWGYAYEKLANILYGK